MAIQTLNQVITEAVTDIERHGFDSQDRVNQWIRSILAISNLYQDTDITEYLKRSLGGKYTRLITNCGIQKQHKIPVFTLEKVKPACRAELDRRIMASANLIKLNRSAAIQKTIQRFSGWATSIPIGGSDVVDKNEIKMDIKKPLKDLTFIERRVAIDQGHKLVANINDIVAIEAGAIAAVWRSHFRQSGYDYRKDHKERDSKIYAIKSNWAIRDGLMKVGPDGYTDQITMPGEEVYCRCFYEYVYNLKSLPDNMLTEKYRKKVKETNRVMA